MPSRSVGPHRWITIHCKRQGKATIAKTDTAPAEAPKMSKKIASVSEGRNISQSMVTKEIRRAAVSVATNRKSVTHSTRSGRRAVGRIMHEWIDWMRASAVVRLAWAQLLTMNQISVGPLGWMTNSLMSWVICMDDHEDSLGANRILWKIQWVPLLKIQWVPYHGNSVGARSTFCSTMYPIQCNK